MTVDEFMDSVVELFRSGRANENHYREMARAVVDSSMEDGTPEIDAALGVNDEET